MANMSAAQLAVVVAALREDETPAPGNGKKPPQRDLRKQPRINREVMLELARRNNPDVRDMGG